MDIVGKEQAQVEYIETAEERVGYEMARARRYGLPLTLVLISCPDNGETDPMEIILSKIRAADIAKPFGENLVLVMLPHTGLDGGMGFARRILDDLLEITVQAGAGVASISLQHSTGDDLISEVEEALAAATDDNPVVAFGETPIS